MAGIRVSGLWEKTAPNGDKYYEGTWGPCTIRVYSNKYKKSDRDPECVVYLSEKPKDDKRKGPPVSAAATKSMFGGAPPPKGPPPTKRYDPPSDMPDMGDVPWPDSQDGSPF